MSGAPVRVTAGLVLVALLGATGCRDKALVEDTRIIGKMFFAGKVRPGESPAEFKHTPTRAYLAAHGPGSDLRFQGSARMGPIWAVVHVVARPEAPTSDGEAIFTLGPTQVAMRPTDGGFVLKSRNMRKPDGPLLVNGRAPMTGVNPKAHISGEDLLALDSPLLVRRAIEIRHFPVGDGRDGDSQFLLSLESHRNLRPVFVEVTIGQGPLPRELEAYIRDVNGSWFVRYRKEAGFIAGILLCGAFALWWMRRAR
jgi:hypothetical protein